ncbi:fumarylacetoacetate hydrolase family protein [Pseudoalteromonas sp.]|uniref:fumarylacetoacetate hydrolase family protein n=1 Tax=Pseudoalteromonas sp. TaxID=53249 RepID=UPI003563274F
MTYLWNNGEAIELPIGKAVCVGRNYVAHAEELGNDVPTEPLLFLKPASSIVNAEGEVVLDHSLGEHHYEAELMLLIGKPLNKGNIEDYKSCIAGLGVGLDLTLRDEQAKLKAKGHPWERAKAYDQSCLVSRFLPLTEGDLTHSEFSLSINDELRQSGDTHLMIFKIEQLLAEIVQYFSLQPGDLVLTGTPQGVGRLNAGDRLALSLNSECLAEFTVD